MSATGQAHQASSGRTGRAALENWRGSLSVRLAGLSDDEASFSKRGFAVSDPQRRDRLEGVGRAFIAGYNLALVRANLPASVPLQPLTAELETIAPALRGFAHEGAAMGLGISDALPWARNGNLARFLGTAGDRHAYLIHVGAGWAMARLPWRRRAILRVLDPLLAPLAIDGWGFHDIYFSPARLGAGARGGGRDHRRAFDQGAGRALWFVAGGDIDRALALITAQRPDRRCDLLSGLALAMTYTALAEPGDVAKLAGHADQTMPDGRAAVAQGAAFALEARALAGLRLPQGDAICSALCDRAPDAVLGIVRAHRPATSDVVAIEAETGTAAYEVWRQRVQAALTKPTLAKPATAGSAQGSISAREPSS
ncbi:MAG: DUF1702 family protein [Phyllobacteriaceae bacterium]|jgi:hypothetical protein|nr:DUF1702 family protein [Phyllobacteriaceae bacterium]